MLRPLLLLPLAAALLTFAAFGGRSAGETQGSSGAETKTVSMTASAASQTRIASSRAQAGKRIKVIDSEFGRVIADRRGEALYVFGREDRHRSKCYGACARTWPPVTTAGRPRAIGSAEQRLLGVTRRADGTLQVTYAGHPLYYYAGDSPGQILCNDVEEFGGLWLVLEPSGEPYEP